MPRTSSQPANATPKAERTRLAILAAAEDAFAFHGFAATRLEDVAAAVGIRRASIVYYFKDKRELYDFVLASVFGDLLERLERVLFSGSGKAGAQRCIEAAVSEWVDFVAERPSFARLLLREVADATPERRPEALLRQLSPFYELANRFMAQHGPDGLPDADPAQMASTLAGATLFHVAAMPTLVPDMAFDPRDPAHLEQHRAEILRLTRRFLRRGPARAKAPRTNVAPRARKERR